jgi:transposase-like protein
VRRLDYVLQITRATRFLIMDTSQIGSDLTVSKGPQKPTRRKFSDEYKLRILEEVERCTEFGEIGLILRREGLYTTNLSDWRKWRRRRFPHHPQSQKPATQGQIKDELTRLQRENARLKLKLEHTEKIVALQKKFTEMLTESEIDENSP